MKILSIIKTTDSSYGGPPEVLKNQMEAINREKKIINVLCLNSLSYLLLLKGLLFKSHRARFYKLLKKFDIIHFHEIWSLKVIFIVYFANKILTKFFFVGHGYLDDWSIKQKYIKKKLFIKFFLQKAYNSSHAAFFSTINELHEVEKNLKIKDAFIIPNGLSLKKYKERKLNNKIKKKIIFFGRVHKKKGLNLLLNVIKKLPDDYFDQFYFEITGPGLSKDINNLKQIITDPSLQKRVKYNNPIYGNNKIEYLKNCDIFILPSFEEGDSIALKEALGSYLPVIISKQCRLDIIREYNAGIVVDTNEKSLYEALLKLKTSNILKMSYQARRLIENEYDNENCSKRLKSIYLDLYNQDHKSKDWIKY